MTSAISEWLPLERIISDPTIPERLSRYLALNVKEDENKCWLWQGKLTTTGYVNVSIDYVRQYFHRWVYEQLIGEIPDGMDLDHLCKKRHCSNPCHLEPVTRQENVLRGDSFAALNAKKTHCKRGHELTGSNLIFNPTTNKRNCLECRRVKDREFKRELRASKKVGYELN